jgi:putative addiction module killer protein
MAELIEVREYQDRRGHSPFAHWFDRLDPAAAAKVAVSLARLAQGNVGALKSVGAGVQELRINFGPGYRVYLGREGGSIVILLGGGSKSRQRRDIATAVDRWHDYKERKKRVD